MTSSFLCPHCGYVILKSEKSKHFAGFLQIHLPDLEYDFRKVEHQIITSRIIDAPDSKKECSVYNIIGE